MPWIRLMEQMMAMVHAAKPAGGAHWEDLIRVRVRPREAAATATVTAAAGAEDQR